MTGPAVQSGSAEGGFIEGAFGGFTTITDFKRRRRIEQQVAARLGRQDVRQVALDEEAAEDRARAQAIQDFELSQEHGVRFDPTAVQGRVDQLRQGVGEAITPGASLPPGFTRVGPSADERETEERGGFLGKVAEFMALSPEEREAAMQDPDMRQALDEIGKFDDVFDVATAPPAGSTVRFGVTGTGGRTLTGGTREQADEFAREFPHTPRPSTPSNLSVSAAFQILKDRYAKFEDDGTGKLVFSGYEKPLDVILTEARDLASGGQMVPRALEAPEVEEEKGPGFIERARQAIQGIGRPEVSSGESPLDRFLQVSGAEEERGPRFMEAQMRALELEEEGKTREEIRRIMSGEGYNVRL